MHGKGTNLIVDEGDLFGDTLLKEFELKLQVLASEYSVIVLIDVSSFAIVFGPRHFGQVLPEKWQLSPELRDLLLLLLRKYRQHRDMNDPSALVQTSNAPSIPASSEEIARNRFSKPLARSANALRSPSLILFRCC